MEPVKNKNFEVGDAVTWNSTQGKVTGTVQKKLTDWLGTAKSKKVGFKSKPSGESVGHDSGRKIVTLLRKKQSDYTADDMEHVTKVIGFIHRAQTQRSKRASPVMPITHRPLSGLRAVGNRDLEIN